MTGYPDFFGQSIFPRYGPVTMAEITNDFTEADTWHPLVNLEGQGVLLGYEIELVTVPPSNHIQARITIDENDPFSIWGITPNFLSNIGKGSLFLEPISFNSYDHRCVYGKYIQIPFNSKIMIEVYDDIGGGPSHTGRAWYYNIV